MAKERGQDANQYSDISAKHCGSTFVIDSGFKGRHFPVYIITLALLLNSMNLTPKETSLVLSKRPFS